jgi:hypothetical protein
MNQDTYVMNLNESMQQRIIKVLKGEGRSIAELAVQVEKLMPEYNEKRNFYESVKRDFDSVQAQMDALKDEIKEAEQIVNVIAHFKEKDSVTKILKGVKLGTKKEGKQSPKKIGWLDGQRRILEKENRFLSWDELWAGMAKDETIQEAATKTKTGFHNAKAAAFNNLNNHCQAANNPRGRFIIMYKEKYGLTEWLDESGVVRVDHLKEFMHNLPIRPLKVVSA